MDGVIDANVQRTGVANEEDSGVIGSGGTGSENSKKHGTCGEQDGEHHTHSHRAVPGSKRVMEHGRISADEGVFNPPDQESMPADLSRRGRCSRHWKVPPDAVAIECTAP